jgi:hypothetical protein
MKTPEDPGCATVLLRNDGKKPVRVDRLLMDGAALPCSGIASGLAARHKPSDDPALQAAAARIIWARFEPNPVPPGRSALLYLQFRHRPLYPFRLRLLSGDAVIANCQVAPVQTPVRITNVTFPRDLSACCIYVENRALHPKSMETIELNGRDVTTDAWMSEQKLSPGRKALVIIPTPGLRTGEAATMLVRFNDGETAVGRVRVLPTFPIVLEHGAPEEALSIEAEQALWPARPGNAPFPKLTDATAVVRVFHCPSHILRADWTGAAHQILRRRAAVLAKRPELPTYVGVCRARSELACPAFAHTTDAGFLNPCLPKYSRSDPPRPLDALLRAMAMLRNANAPDPCFVLLSAHAFDDTSVPACPSHLRRQAYAALACGARGVIYRLCAGRRSPACLECVNQLNERIRRMAPQLLVAAPVDWASSSNPRVHARTLLAGRSGILLFLLSEGTADGARPSASAVEVTVRLPEWIGRLRLTPESDPLKGTVSAKPGRIRVTARHVPPALVLVFRPASEGSPAAASEGERSMQAGERPHP